MIAYIVRLKHHVPEKLFLDAQAPLLDIRRRHMRIPTHKRRSCRGIQDEVCRTRRRRTRNAGGWGKLKSCCGIELIARDCLRSVAPERRIGSRTICDASSLILRIEDAVRCPNGEFTTEVRNAVGKTHARGKVFFAVGYQTPRQATVPGKNQVAIKRRILIEHEIARARSPD